MTTTDPRHDIPITIVKTQIIAMPRTLKGKWTVEGLWDMDDSKFQYRVTKTNHHEWQVDMHAFWVNRKNVIEWCKETFGAHGNHRRYKWRINYNCKQPDRIFFATSLI